MLSLLAVLTASCLLTACNSSSDTPPQRSLSYSAVGRPLNTDFTVNNLFVAVDSVYLTHGDSEDGNLGYAKIPANAGADHAYHLTYLTLPASTQYTVIGDMVIDELKAQVYLPVASLNGGFYNYAWLQYESGATAPNALPVGSYKVTAGLANQFALESATVFNGSIYANYAGTVVGFNTSTGQVGLQKENFLVSSQDAIWIQDKNTVIAINSDGNSIVRKNPETNEQIQIGESFSTLHDQGFEVSPHFTVHEGLVSVLAIQRSETTGHSHLALCRVGYQSGANKWACDVSLEKLPHGSQILNLDTDVKTGSIYFVLQSLAHGSQLYKIN